MDSPSHSAEPWSIEFSADWHVFNDSGIFGGLLLATVARAAVRATGLQPASIAAQLPAAVVAGEPVTVRTMVRRAGRHSQDVGVTLSQDGSPRVNATATVLASADPPEQSHSVPPAHSPSDGEAVVLPAALVPFAQHYEYSLIGSDRPLGGGPEPKLTAWVRPLLPATDPASSTVAMLDALPPALFAVRTTPVAIPTLEFSAYLTPGLEPGGWLFITQRTLWSTERFCVDEAVAVTEKGALAGTARQLRQIVRPRAR